MYFPKVDVAVKCDLLVVGGGLAGSFAGIAAKEAGAGEVVLVDKSYVSRSGQSPFAAGIFTVFDPEEDDFQVWMKEIVQLGEYLNDQEWVKLLFERTCALAKKLDGWGEEYGWQVFEKDDQGRMIRRRSRGHLYTKHNVINSLPMMSTLRRKLKELGVKVLDNLMITDLLYEDGRAIGAVGLAYREKKTYLLLAKATVLAASGCGFKSVFIGHRNLTGDLQAAAFDVGAVMQNMENNSSNTGARDYDIHGLNLYVGVGGKFLNGKGEEFMWKYHPALGNRARLQDLVLAFCREVEEGRGPVWLDMSAASAADRALCRKILPESFMTWDRAGIDPFAEKIPWIPAFYGTLISGGGIRVGLNGETNIPGLFAAGDITPIPPHGTYSFGGINLCFCVVSGQVAGEGAAAAVREAKPVELTKARRNRAKELVAHRLLPLTRKKGIEPYSVIQKVQEAIIPSPYGYLRTGETIKESLKRIAQVQSDLLPEIRASNPHELVKAIEAQSIAKVARMIMEAALHREESRGWHFRKDFPRTDNVNWLKWVLLKKDGDNVKLWTEAVPTPYIKPGEDYSIPPGVRRNE